MHLSVLIYFFRPMSSLRASKIRMISIRLSVYCFSSTVWSTLTMADDFLRESSPALNELKLPCDDCP